MGMPPPFTSEYLRKMAEMSYPDAPAALSLHAMQMCCQFAD
jgi:hypothetical protein